jgi:AcrR family transcriptional regulator
VGPGPGARADGGHLSQIAVSAGIGRARLYKYFPDVASILRAFHDGHVADHLALLAELRDQDADPPGRLRRVLDGYTQIELHRGRHGTDELTAMLHFGPPARDAMNEVRGMFIELIAEAAEHGLLRTDVPAEEFADFCLGALSAARRTADQPAAQRLVTLTLDALEGPRHSRSRPPGHGSRI